MAGWQPKVGAGLGESRLPKYSLDRLNWDQPWAQMSTGFSGGQEGGLGSPDLPVAGGPMGNLLDLPTMRPWNITPGALGTGADTPDSLWDKYQAREVEGAMGAGTNIVNGHDLDTQSGRADFRQEGGWVEGSGSSGGYDYEGGGSSGHGGGSEANAQGKTYNTQGGGGGGGGGGQPQQQGQGNLVITPDKKAELAIEQGKLDLANRAEDNRHAEALATAKTEADRVAEIARHNAAQEELDRRKQDLDVEMNKLDNATKIEIQRMADIAARELEGMKEAHAIRLEMIQEAHKILMEQGGQAFKDWQERQKNYMNILGSALGNPWLQRLSGMAPAGGMAAVTGGGNIKALLQKVLAPFDYTYAFGEHSQAQAPQGVDALNANVQFGGTEGGAEGAVGEENVAPQWAAWQTWSPYQKAAYRANVEAIGPGAWQSQQAAAMNQFAAQGGSPDVTQLAAQSATPEQSIGQQMTAEMFGQTPEQWQTQQSRQWSQAQAPQVKSQSTIDPLGPSQQQSPEQQLGI